MKITSLTNNNGNPQKEVAILMLNNGNEILTHYGVPVAGIINGTPIKTDKFHSITTSKNINLYLCGCTAETVKQETLDILLEQI